MTSPTAYRLPATVRPRHYDLTFEPNFSSFTFAGTATITLTVAEATDVIQLHAAELSISAASAVLADGTTVEAEATDVDEAAERATISFPRALPAGEAKLVLAFTGTLNDQMRGFYRSRYETASGMTDHLASTQFEATDARRAFPCWDEPAIKASFALTLIVPESLTAVSNMPVVSDEVIPGGRREMRFEPTPVMSTYLLAFVVGDIACVQERAGSGTLIRVWTTRGKEEQGRFALENSVRILDYMDDYFGIPYPLPKLDHIAIPDFAAGAMENWGVITYRETALLFDPENSAAHARQRILEVVAHEMAHMWFGDLVTMEWWDDLWLNESFASWMGDKAVDHLYPQWQMWTQFVSHDTNAALGLDGLRNSHPIEAKVSDPAEIRELFDAISYSKGGSVLRMLEDYLGEETFRTGLHAYLSAHSYANARTEHLWSAMAEASGQPVTRIMDSWVKQMGYPVLDVELSRTADGLTIGFRQERFLYDRLLGDDAPGGGGPDGSVWEIPVGVVRGGAEAERESMLMDGTTGSMSLSLDPSSSWVKVNAGQTGFFRVRYPDDEWERLREAVAALALPPTDRLGLQNDAYALMRAGSVPATVFLSMAQAFAGETDATVWGDLAANLRGFEGLLLDEPCIDDYRAFARGLLSTIAGVVGWDAAPGEEHLDALRRSTVLGQFGGYGDPATLAEARKRFEAYLGDPASLHPDLRGVVVGLVAQEGGRETYDTLWRLEKEAQLHEEKMRLLGALTRFRDPALLGDLLRRSLGDEVRSQDAMGIIVQTAGNRHGRDLAWAFVQDNWDEIDRRYGKGGFAIMRLVGITGGFTTLERHDEVQAFFEAHPAPSAARTIQQSLERIRLNAAWLDQNRTVVGDWLSSRA
ncbi:MAG: M1 family metallopeptidase [Chloroflexi bacterium]|nr:M1 family metallopeptidase [Chloroflexota bacterium]